MLKYSVTTQVNADPNRTFDVFSDLRSAPGRISAIKKLDVLTEGPIGKGTRFRETRIMFNREATEEMEITDFQPGRSYTVGGTSCGMAWSSTFRFAPADGGTRVEMDVQTQAVSFFAKLMSPLAKFMAGSMKKCIEQDMKDLKRALEGPA